MNPKIPVVAISSSAYEEENENVRFHEGSRLNDARWNLVNTLENIPYPDPNRNDGRSLCSFWLIAARESWNPCSKGRSTGASADDVI